MRISDWSSDVGSADLFSGDYRSWEDQVRALSRRYRCITVSARGLPGADVPPDVESYSQARAVQDAVSVLDAVDSQRAHVVGVSMGGFTALNLVLDHHDRFRSAVVGICGSGAAPAPEIFKAEMEALDDVAV